MQRLVTIPVYLVLDLVIATEISTVAGDIALVYAVRVKALVFRRQFQKGNRVLIPEAGHQGHNEAENYSALELSEASDLH
jgi:hypothetical protein